MVITQKNKCAMCGKDTIGKDRLDNYNKENEQKQQQENKPSSIITTMITVEQIDETYYFDTEDCNDVQKVHGCLWKQFFTGSIYENHHGL
jgi:hypothetical protein